MRAQEDALFFYICTYKYIHIHTCSAQSLLLCHLTYMYTGQFIILQVNNEPHMGCDGSVFILVLGVDVWMQTLTNCTDEKIIFFQCQQFFLFFSA